MYVQHFGLEHEPFSIAPDPRYLYLSERHREALAHLLYGLGAGGGFVLLTGEIGAGKTTVCRCFLEQVPAHCQVAYIFNPKLTVIELLGAVCEEFGITLPEAANSAAAPTIKGYIDPLNHFLLEAHAAGRNCVLVIDEAQQLSAEVLEQLRLLTNLETSERKLLQIILVGQPELRDMLAQPGLEQLAQRVIARYHLGPLSEADTARYLQHRLAIAGLKNASPLGPALVRRIHGLSGGVPRRINLLCDRALLGAYSQGLAEVNGKTLLRAAQEIGGDEPAGWLARRRGQVGVVPGQRPWRIAGVGAGVLSLLALAAFAAGWRPGDGAGDHTRAAAVSPARTQASGGAGMGVGVVAGTPPGALSASVSAPAAAAASSPLLASTASAGGAGQMTRHAAPLKPDELRRLLRLHGVDESGGWRLLASRWGLAASDDGDPCAAVARQGVQCFKGGGGLALVRQLDRPVMLGLRDAGAPPVYVVLVGIDPQLAWLQIGPDTWAVPLTELAGWWRGDFATLWRTPAAVPGDGPGQAGTSPGTAAWLAERLTGVGVPVLPAAAGSPERALRARLVSFQVSQGLDPDGLPGPLTVMTLNRASGVAEPHLAARP